MVNMVNTAVNNNIYAGRKPGSKYNQSHTFQQKEVLEVPDGAAVNKYACLLYTSPSPRDGATSRMPSSA